MHEAQRVAPHTADGVADAFELRPNGRVQLLKDWRNGHDGRILAQGEAPVEGELDSARVER